MRKIVWFFSILFVALCVLVLISYLFPPVHAAIGSGLTWALGSVWTAITGGWASLGSFMGSTGFYFLAWTLGVAVATFISAATLHSLWNKHAPAAFGGQKTQGSSITLQTNPPPSPPQTIKVKQEEKPEAATA